MFQTRTTIAWCSKSDRFGHQCCLEIVNKLMGNIFIRQKHFNGKRSAFVCHIQLDVADKARATLSGAAHPTNWVTGVVCKLSTNCPAITFAETICKSYRKQIFASLTPIPVFKINSCLIAPISKIILVELH